MSNRDNYGNQDHHNARRMAGHQRGNKHPRDTSEDDSRRVHARRDNNWDAPSQRALYTKHYKGESTRDRERHESERSFGRREQDHLNERPERVRSPLYSARAQARMAEDRDRHGHDHLDARPERIKGGSHPAKAEARMEENHVKREPADHHDMRPERTTGVPRPAGAEARTADCHEHTLSKGSQDIKAEGNDGNNKPQSQNSRKKSKNKNKGQETQCIVDAVLSASVQRYRIDSKLPESMDMYELRRLHGMKALQDLHVFPLYLIPSIIISPCVLVKIACAVEDMKMWLKSPRNILDENTVNIMRPAIEVLAQIARSSKLKAKTHDGLIEFSRTLDYAQAAAARIRRDKGLQTYISEGLNPNTTWGFTRLTIGKNPPTLCIPNFSEGLMNTTFRHYIDAVGIFRQKVKEQDDYGGNLEGFTDMAITLAHSYNRLVLPESTEYLKQIRHYLDHIAPLQRKKDAIATTVYGIVTMGFPHNLAGLQNTLAASIPAANGRGDKSAEPIQSDVLSAEAQDYITITTASQLGIADNFPVEEILSGEAFTSRAGPQAPPMAREAQSDARTNDGGENHCASDSVEAHDAAPVTGAAEVELSWDQLLEAPVDNTPSDDEIETQSEQTATADANCKTTERTSGPDKQDPPRRKDAPTEPMRSRPEPTRPEPDRSKHEAAVTHYPKITKRQRPGSEASSAIMVEDRQRSPRRSRFSNDPHGKEPIPRRPEARDKRSEKDHVNKREHGRATCKDAEPSQDRKRGRDPDDHDSSSRKSRTTSSGSMLATHVLTSTHLEKTTLKSVDSGTRRPVNSNNSIPDPAEDPPPTPARATPASSAEEIAWQGTNVRTAIENYKAAQHAAYTRLADSRHGRRIDRLTEPVTVAHQAQLLAALLKNGNQVCNLPEMEDSFAAAFVQSLGWSVRNASVVDNCMRHFVQYPPKELLEALGIDQNAQAARGFGVLLPSVTLSLALLETYEYYHSAKIYVATCSAKDGKLTFQGVTDTHEAHRKQAILVPQFELPACGAVNLPNQVAAQLGYVDSTTKLPALPAPPCDSKILRTHFDFVLSSSHPSGEPRAEEPHPFGPDAVNVHTYWAPMGGTATSPWLNQPDWHYSAVRAARQQTFNVLLDAHETKAHTPSSDIADFEKFHYIAVLKIAHAESNRATPMTVECEPMVGHRPSPLGVPVHHTAAYWAARPCAHGRAQHVLTQLKNLSQRNEPPMALYNAFVDPQIDEPSHFRHVKDGQGRIKAMPCPQTEWHKAFQAQMQAEAEGKRRKSWYERADHMRGPREMAVEEYDWSMEQTKPTWAYNAETNNHCTLDIRSMVLAGQVRRRYGANTARVHKDPITSLVTSPPPTPEESLLGHVVNYEPDLIATLIRERGLPNQPSAPSTDAMQKAICALASTIKSATQRKLAALDAQPTSKLLSTQERARYGVLAHRMLNMAMSQKTGPYEYPLPTRFLQGMDNPSAMEAEVLAAIRSCPVHADYQYPRGLETFLSKLSPHEVCGHRVVLSDLGELFGDSLLFQGHSGSSLSQWEAICIKQFMQRSWFYFRDAFPSIYR